MHLRNGTVRKLRRTTNHVGVAHELTFSCYQYIHRNPVRRGLVAHETDWPWSSARWYAGDADVRLTMDATPPAM